jgi:hypothetical protein
MSSVALVVAVDMVFILVLCAYSKKIRGGAEQV